MRNLLEQEKIDKYLDRLCSRLFILSREARAEARREVHQHLETLIAAHEARGMEPADAVAAALRRFGDPVKTGRKMAAAWPKEDHNPGYARATRWAFFIAGWMYIAVMFFHVNLSALLISAVMLAVVHKPIGVVFWLFRRQLKDRGIDLSGTLWPYMTGEPAVNPLRRLNPRFFIVNLVVFAIILLLPLHAPWKGVLYSYWSLYAFGLILRAEIYWIIKQRLSRAK